MSGSRRETQNFPRFRSLAKRLLSVPKAEAKPKAEKETKSAHESHH
jgi:hypothetical protein